MNEQELRNLRMLGLEPPEEEGVNEQDPAEPVAEDEAEAEPEAETTSEDEDEDGEAEEGANEQEVAEPADDKEETPEQTAEQRARNAQRRREREARKRQQEIDQAVQQALQAEREKTNAKIKDIFNWAKFQDGTQPIETIEQMEAYRQRVQAGQLEKDLKAGKLTPEALQQMVAAEVAKTATPPPADDTAAVNTQFMQQVETELAEIRKYDPNIKSVADLRTLDRAEAFQDAVANHGHSFIDAYRFVYADKIAAKQAAAAAQRAANSARGKDHLRKTGSSGTGDVNVPDEVLRNAKRLMPNSSAEDIRKYYQKTVKK